MVLYEKADEEYWRLRQYFSPMGRGAIDDWRADFESASRRADLDNFLRIMITKSSWVFPDVRGLHGKQLKGLYELRWRSDNGVPHRIGGYFSAGGEFVMLIGWTHNKKKYDPAAALETILVRKNKLKTGAATTREYEIVTGRRTQK